MARDASAERSEPSGRYDSPLREQRAAETRQSIISTARRQFEDSGFERTTVNAIATGAGVSPATVYATFGSKAGIVAAMLEHLEEDADMGERIPAMLAEQDPHRGVALFAAGNRAVFEGGHGLLRAALDAIGNPEVAALAEAGDANRRRACDFLIKRWHAAGGLRDGLRPKQAAERMWLLTSVQQYLLAVDVLGWSPAAYERWLTGLLQRELLGTEA